MGSRVEAWPCISLPDAKVCSDKFLTLLGTFQHMCQTSIISIGCHLLVVFYLWDVSGTVGTFFRRSVHMDTVLTCLSPSEKMLKWLHGQVIFISALQFSFIKKKKKHRNLDYLLSKVPFCLSIFINLHQILLKKCDKSRSSLGGWRHQQVSSSAVSSELYPWDLSGLLSLWPLFSFFVLSVTVA